MELAVRNPVTWIVYAAIYVMTFAGLTVLLWLDLGQHQRGPVSVISLLAIVSAAAAGIALFAALSWEVLRAMVLLAPMLKKWIEERARREGRQEGLAEGEERGQKAERQRWEAWLRRRNEAEANNQPFDEPPPSQGS